MYKLILQKKTISLKEMQAVETLLNTQLTEYPNKYEALLSELPSKVDLRKIRQTYDFDANIVSANFEPGKIKLVVSDMDSTLINIECVDEIADFAGVRDEVSKITEAAMNGELDFAQSLRARVKLLAGLDESVLQRVYMERLKLNPGAELMLKYLRNNDIEFALVSGGFTYFTDRLKQRLLLDYTLANVLEIDGGKLTGEIYGNIVDADAKANFLLEKCQTLNISPSQVVAIGDGANDLKMMAAAGLGVAYHAKPKVQEIADCALNHSGLEGLLVLLSLDHSE